MGGNTEVKKWNMVIDCARCHDCNNCFLADKDEFVGNDFPPYSVAQPWSGHRWMDIERKERGQYPIVQAGYLPKPCQHCADAPCMDGSPAGTIYRREDGLVLIDPERAKGHPEIVGTCPYGAIYWNAEADVAQKCTGCAHLIDAGWTETRCSQVCPTNAIRLVLADDAEWAALVEKEELLAHRAELRTNPRVMYKNLYKWDKVFASGSVAYKDTDECADGAAVTVSTDGAVAGEGLVNNYGEFVVDKLEPGKSYTVKIVAQGYKPVEKTVTLRESLNLGLVLLDKA
jgi:Fe-S-cluster-containing dehydrogenase component